MSALAQAIDETKGRRETAAKAPLVMSSRPRWSSRVIVTPTTLRKHDHLVHEIPCKGVRPDMLLNFRASAPGHNVTSVLCVQPDFVVVEQMNPTGFDRHVKVTMLDIVAL